MWLLVAQITLLLYSYWVHCHLPSYASTPSSKVEQYCLYAETCLHDTIPVCGKMGDEKRTFLDLCDMLEYACDTNMVYNHIEDIDGCPVFKDAKLG